MKKLLIRLCALALLLSMSLTGCTSGVGGDDTTGDTAADTPIVTDTPTAAPTEETTEEVTEAPDLSLKLVVDGTSDYVIEYDSDLTKISAYTFREVLKKATGVELRMDDSEYGTPTGYEFAVSFYDGDAEALGNYGYDISVASDVVNIKAATLSGFDMAINRLLNDCSADGTVKVPEDYAVSENLNWASDYVLEGDDFKTEYVDGMFYNDKNDSVAYVSNAMWHMFGLVDDGQGLVYRFGNEPTWYEWMSEKMMWSGNAGYIGELKGKLRSFPQVSTGYMWSWGSFPYWKVDNCYSIHYDGTFRYIASVYDVISWEGNTDFLYETDTDTAGG